MSCGCSFNRESYFGLQLRDSGTDRQMSAAETDKAVYFPSNPYGFNSELGIVGLRYGSVDYIALPPEYARGGYQGVLPLDQQPKLEMEQPYNRPVVF